MNFSGWEILVVLFIVLLLFGSTRLPQLAKGMGKSIREFKKGINDGESDTAELDAAQRRERLNAGDAATTTSTTLREDELASDKALRK
ncbi:MAG TPA: twin-arginine translocase TatA/TatE family subunit [Pyrinomonadaceae bacterium]|nr:twin-arginine translocase TatA/TatE family subunit [Pyrinomonadaceae bacterium]